MQLPSTRQPGVVVHDAEDPATAPAVADERGVAVDAAPARRAAVDELANLAVAAAVPGTLDLGLDLKALRHPVFTDASSRSALERLSVGAEQALPRFVDGIAPGIDEPPEVVDGASVLHPQGVTVPVDT